MLIKLNDIYTDDEFNCRGDFSHMDVVELAQSIEAQGLLQPITVCETNKVERFKNKTDRPYSLIMGFRRLKAHYVLEREYIECNLNDNIKSEVDARLANLVENVSRENLTFDQEALAIKGLYELKFNREDIGRFIGKSSGWVQTRIMFLSLPEQYQKEFANSGLNQDDLRKLKLAHRQGGETLLHEVFLKLKEARQKGHTSVKGLKAKLDNNTRRARSKSEIIQLISLLIDYYEASHATRFLAWAAGEIDDRDLELELKEYANELGKPHRSLRDEI